MNNSLPQACCSVVFLLQSISLGFEFSFTVSAQKFYDPNAPSYSPEADSLVMTDEQISWFGESTVHADDAHADAIFLYSQHD